MKRSKGIIDDLVLSIRKFEDWLKKSKKGTTLVYYRGFLYDPWQQKLSPTMSVTNINKLRDHVYSAYTHGLVTLVPIEKGVQGAVLTTRARLYSSFHF